MKTVDSRITDITSSLYRVASRAVIVNDGKLLLVKEMGDNYWTVPGGGVDYGEDLHEALTRELNEEVGLKPGEYEFNREPVLISPAISEGIPRLNIYFKVNLTTGVIKVSEEIESFIWCSADEVMKTYYEDYSKDAQYLVDNILAS